ncbi:catalase-peroxidase [Microdochium nivale]|nr:catalase-peroxidase [Microdochium nivale]
MKRASDTAEHDRGSAGGHHGTASPSSSSPKRVRTPRSVSSSGSSGVSNSKGLRKTGVMTTCKTCIACRQKKVKCDSKRPECGACSAKGIDCAYPNDTRRLLRPSQQTVGHIEQRLATIWDNINAARQSKIPLPDEPTLLDASLNVQSWLPTTQSQVSSAQAAAGAGAGRIEPTDRRVRQRISDSDENLSEVSLSPHEAHIAGVDVGRDGLISVHGASSMMHPRPPPAALQQSSSGSSSRPFVSRKSSRAAIQARLVSHAAVQRQRESFVYSNPPATMDLDGVDPELARHLIDLHWNRQHYAYLLTYRPAVMDSLINGGRWCNKLLLNAMYYTSSLYSDRECLRSTPQDTQSAGDRFYRRF